MIPGSERCPGGGKWQPTPVFLPRKFPRAMVCGVAKSRTQPSTCTHTHDKPTENIHLSGEKLKVFPLRSERKYILTKNLKATVDQQELFKQETSLGVPGTCL